MKNSESYFTRILRLKRNMDKNRFSAKILFLFFGVLSTIWFLIRVIPKPSRATYPCIQAAAPFASSFVIYLLSITSGTYFLKRSLQAATKKKYLLTGSLILAMVGAFTISLLFQKNESFAADQELKSAAEFTLNNPVGEAKGLFPGRVVWVHDADATNKNWTKDSPEHATSDANVDQAVVNNMLDRGMKYLTQSNSVSGAWNKLFKNFNETHGRGINGYTTGEKIAIKVNFTNNGRDFGDRVDQTPQIMFAILNHLVNEVGVAQPDITIGDPYRGISQVYLDKFTSAFPDVIYVSREATGILKQTKPTADNILVFSDGQFTSTLPQYYVDADYFINMTILKSHDSGGITLGAKNHQGSVIQADGTPENQSALFMHYSFPDSKHTPGYKKYRHLVDYMGHEHLGGKTLLYLVDALWAGHNWKGVARHWDMPPFNGDYPNSLFLAQDPVAMESVGYDFLLEEYKNKPENEQYPYYVGADDFILQAADPANWPDNIQYDPEGYGSVLTSLGVHEHWNNGTDKQYSRNLGTGSGIELIKIFENTQLPDFSGTEDPANYHAPKAASEPVIDGTADEDCWQEAPWAEISIDWFEEAGKNPPSFDSLDFYGRYKATWSPNYLFLLVQITDDVLNDDIADPLEKYFNEDCIEIFIDEDNSGGDHRNNQNAWAYHTSPVTFDVVDLNSNGDPQLYNDHIDFAKTANGTTYTVEYRIRIYDDTYTDANPSNSRVTLQENTIMGFSIAYCEDDGNGRENFIGTISGGMDSFKDANLLGNLTLLPGAPTKYNLTIENGTGSGAFEKDAIVNIAADAAPENQEFDQWVGDIEFVASHTSSATTVTMPDKSIALTATFKDIPTNALNTSKTSKVKLYPNPVTDFLHAEYTDYNEIRSIQIYSLNGKLISSVNKNFKMINVEDLTRGMYVVKIDLHTKSETYLISKK